jgi:carotene epsilon-monooxygenase
LGGSEIPVASYKPADFAELFGGALFLVLKRFQEEKGDGYLLPTGPATSFLVLSDPASAGHVLGNCEIYHKELMRELSFFLFGTGFPVADGEPWKVRRRAVAPSLHKRYLDFMVQSVFTNFSLRTAEVLAKKGQSQSGVDMEIIFSELTLDIIGKAIFNFDFKAVETDGDNPVREAVYTAFKEVEKRSIDFAPVWKLPGDLPAKISPRQKRAVDAVGIIRKTTEDLIEHARLEVEAEEAAGTAAQFDEKDYLAEADPSILRFLIASHEEVTSSQLRDDLLGMLVAGHETIASVLTWTLYLLVTNPDKMAKVQEEIDGAFGAGLRAEALTIGDLMGLNYLRWCVFESMRLYPHPPVLIRRAMQDDVLPNGWKVPKGQEVMVSIYNLHHTAAIWPDPEAFLPERWAKYNTPKDTPTERNTDYHYIPFGCGERRCPGSQFALLEAYSIMTVLLRSFDFHLVEGQDIGMTTGGTIHTTNGMRMTCTPRSKASHR